MKGAGVCAVTSVADSEGDMTEFIITISESNIPLQEMLLLIL